MTCQVHTDTDESVIMVLKGELAELMVAVDPVLYGPFVTTNSKGTPILYVRLKKAMYGMLRSSLLFYRKLRKELEDYGFVVNPYDPCVANKTCVVPKRDKSGMVLKDKNGKMRTEEKQMAVCWHVDDLMMTCVRMISS